MSRSTRRAARGFVVFGLMLVAAPLASAQSALGFNRMPANCRSLPVKRGSRADMRC